MANFKENKWTEADHAYLVENWGRIPLSSIAQHLHRTTMSVRLRAMRKNLPMGGGMVKNNLLVELLKMRFRHLEDFTPSEAFMPRLRSRRADIATFSMAASRSPARNTAMWRHTGTSRLPRRWTRASWTYSPTTIMKENNFLIYVFVRLYGQGQILIYKL